jgi:hypothetical protein
MEEKAFKEMQLKTNEHVSGRWIASNNDLEYRLSITNGECSLDITKNGKQIERNEFSGNAHWFGPFLTFLRADGKQYYARRANEESLIFGENIGATFGGNIQWELEFRRN